jgi:hypothetical protein
MGSFLFFASPERDPKYAHRSLLVIVPVAIACLAAIAWSVLVFQLWFAVLFSVAAVVLGFVLVFVLVDRIVPKKLPVNKEVR